MFYTVAYKGGYIHSSTDKAGEKLRVVFSYEKEGIIYNLHTTCKTITSAKRWISRAAKNA